jgi:hypothetical protein
LLECGRAGCAEQADDECEETAVGAHVSETDARQRRNIHYSISSAARQRASARELRIRPGRDSEFLSAADRSQEQDDLQSSGLFAIFGLPDFWAFLDLAMNQS